MLGLLKVLGDVLWVFKARYNNFRVDFVHKVNDFDEFYCECFSEKSKISTSELI
jgi:hypothetical protein